jgi:hypothetical protein
MNGMLLKQQDKKLLTKAWANGGFAIALTAMLTVAAVGAASANEIVVTSVAQNDLTNCTLPRAIKAHNTAAEQCSVCVEGHCAGCCTKGSGAGSDTIKLSPPAGSPDIFVNELPNIEQGTVILKSGGVTLHGGYFTVDKGATLEVTGNISDSAGLSGETTFRRSLFNVDGTLDIHVDDGHFSDHGTSAFANPGDLGGAIFVGTTGTVILGGKARFTGNNARQKGGVIYNNGGTVKIDLPTDVANQISDNDAISGQGGVIYTTGGTVTVTGIRMANNRANDGPCIFATNHAVVNLANTICEKSTGAAFGRGGGLTAEASSVTINSSTFSNNHEGDQNGSGLGGAIWTDDKSSIAMIDSTCSDNTAVAGGCLWSQSTNFVSLFNLTCTGNKAHVGGCAELNAPANSSNAELAVIGGSTITGNKALPRGAEAALGGAFAVRHGTLGIGASSTVSDNSSGEGGTGDGGAIFGDPSSTLDLVGGATCSRNTAFNGSGGCALAEGSQVKLDLFTCTENSSFRGGCINLTGHDAKLTITTSTINNNRINHDGTGAGINLASYEQATIARTQIIGNLAGAYKQGASSGGGIYAPSHDEITLTQSTVASNTAGAYGAGIELEDFGSLVAVNDTFADEPPIDVPDHGIHSDTSSMTFDFCTFWNAPLLAEKGTTSGRLRNSIFFNSAYCVGNFTPGDKDFDIQYPKPFPGCTKTIPLVDPKLDPTGLQDNGGPTPTVAETKDSPSINGVPLMFCTEPDGTTRVTVDQRGTRRPGGTPDTGQLCDMGAFEDQQK